MLKNYIKVALRNFNRQKGYAFINVFGLAVGIACCVLILFYVRDELRYDRHHENAERIVRVVTSTSDDGQPSNANGSYSAGPTIAREFPEVEYAVRFVKLGWGEKRVVAYEDRRFAEENLFLADSTVFQVFTLPFVYGKPKGALVAPQTVVLSESTARKYFDSMDPVGRVLEIDLYNKGQFEDYTVTGVIRDLPSTSHFQFDLLVSFTSLGMDPGRWGFEPVFTYLQLIPGADLDAVEAGLAAMLERHVGPDWWYTLHLQPLLDIRLHSNLRAELEPNGSIQYVYLFSIIAVFVLLLACINFINLATAQSAQRVQEVGMRKVLGASRVQVVRQFLSEAVVLSMLATVLAFALVQVLLPVFNEVSGKTMEFSLLEGPALWIGALVLALGVGLMAGGYPALFLSRFTPVSALRGGKKGRGTEGGHLRRGLVVFQFAVSIALLVCTAIVYNQMNHLRELNLGFQKEQIIVLPLNDEIRQQYETAEAAFLRDPQVQSMTATEQVPARSGNGSPYWIEGEEPVGHTRLFVNHAFNQTYGINLSAGRDFSEDRPTDVQGAFIVNEALVAHHGWESAEDAIGKGIETEWGGNEFGGLIVGVVEDFQLFSFRQGVQPVVMNIMPLENLNFLSMRIAPEQVGETLKHLRETWATLAPSYPFDYYFLDADFERLHQADQRLGEVFGLFALVAVLVACLGLFGLVSFTVARRTKEIGIRKVLGASVPNVVLLLAREFVFLVAAAFVIAAPLAYIGMQRWLEAFAYQIEPGIGLFVLAAFVALGIALLTVGYQTVRAALSNPVDALRYE